MNKTYFATGVGILGVVGIVGLLVFGGPSVNAEDITVYKSPTCGCCAKWVEHLEQNGFSVTAHDRRDMPTIKAELGVEPEFHSCHTAVINGYLIEGHVPANDIKRLLAEKPPIKGLAVPGMPMGSPGMEGPRRDRYSVLSFDEKGRSKVFSQYD